MSQEHGTYVDNYIYRHKPHIEEGERESLASIDEEHFLNIARIHINSIREKRKKSDLREKK